MKQASDTQRALVALEGCSSWANYVAQDSNGWWWAYMQKPNMDGGVWLEGFSEFLYRDERNPNWHEELYEL